MERDRHPFDGLFSRTTWVRWHQKAYTIMNINEARDDGVAAASAGPYANHLHLAPDRQPNQHLIIRFFTGRMFFLMRNQRCQSNDSDVQNKKNTFFSYWTDYVQLCR